MSRRPYALVAALALLCLSTRGEAATNLKLPPPDLRGLIPLAALPLDKPPVPIPPVPLPAPPRRSPSCLPRAP